MSAQNLWYVTSTNTSISLVLFCPTRPDKQGRERLCSLTLRPGLASQTGHLLPRATRPILVEKGGRRSRSDVPLQCVRLARFALTVSMQLEAGAHLENGVRKRPMRLCKRAGRSKKRLAFGRCMRPVPALRPRSPKRCAVRACGRLAPMGCQRAGNMFARR